MQGISATASIQTPFRVDPEIEDIPKYDLHKGLKNATRQCAGMGAYHKGRNSFAILAQLNPKRVTVDAPHAARLIETLIEKSTQT